jgi:hypothetical protein
MNEINISRTTTVSLLDDDDEVSLMGLTDVAQDKDKWRALVNAVMNLRVSENAEKFLSSLEPVRF